MAKFDFSGWATKANMRCSDGLTILKDAFIGNDGATVPLVWNHQHNDINNVLGHALLENREEGVYVYGKFNDSESGRAAKLAVLNGDVNALSIYANNLKKQMSNVMHGNIREVSLVLAGANPGAFIDSIICHGQDSEEEGIIYTGLEFELYHSEDDDEIEEINTELTHAEMKDTKKEEPKVSDTEKKEKTVQDVVDSMTDEQKNVMYALIGQALEDAGDGGEDVKHSEGGDDLMDVTRNVFEQNKVEEEFLSHADEQAILKLAKTSGVGSLQAAINRYADENDHLAHSIDEIDTLFPEYETLGPKAPEMLTTDQGWVSVVMNGVHRSPIPRIRTRFSDARELGLQAKAHNKGKAKSEMANIKLLERTTDPQMVYIKDKLNREDILSIEDFSVVEYLHGVMKMNLNETLATAFMIGDGRESGDDKIDETKIRPIWGDNPLYAIHQDIDYATAAQELNGSNTGANFGENYIKAEATVTAALYAREDYKGSGNLTYFCTPHALNVMLLARDLNGRRIYNSKADLAAALNVSSIQTVEQFEGKTRTTSDNRVKKLVGIFVNLKDYQIGAVKGGQITSFNQFDIDYNQEKYLIETFISGALVRPFSAIVLEEDVTPASSPETEENGDDEALG